MSAQASPRVPSEPSSAFASPPSSTNALSQKYKLVFLGDQGTGKTSLITRFIFDSFDSSNAPTIGIDFLSKTIYVGERTVRLQLWDTAGQERFKALVPSYARDSHAAIIVYSIASRESFGNTSKWVDMVLGERDRSQVVLVLVGNQSDLTDGRVVSTEEGEAKAAELGANIFIETSAKAGVNVKTMFKRVALALPGMEEAPAAKAEEELQTIQLSAPPPAPQQQAAASGGCVGGQDCML